MIASPGAMLAVFARHLDPDSPLTGLVVGERPEPTLPDDRWTTVTVRAVALNHHDLWSLRGVGLRAEQLPMILGTDAAGIDEDGAEVVVHSVICRDDWLGDETLDPRRSLLSERYPGAMAERVAVPRRNVVRKPGQLSFAEAACLPTAWLTAYRMLFTRAQVAPGQTVLVQGAGGGVATALITLAAAGGVRVWVTSRSSERANRTLALGADRAFALGERLPERVDAVFETVGLDTWEHSLTCVKPGGTIVVSGATSGYTAPTALNRVFFHQIRIVGSHMGTRDELTRLLAFCERTGVRPVIDRVLPLTDAAEGFAALERGEVFGKVVFTLDD